MNLRHAVVSHGAGWHYNTRSERLSEPSLGGLAGSPKTVVVGVSVARHPRCRPHQGVSSSRLATTMTVLGRWCAPSMCTSLSRRIGGARRSATGTEATTVCSAWAEVRSEWRTWDAAPRHVRGSIGCNRDRRMFAYQPCETPLVERTTGALEAHSLSVGGFGLRDTTCWTPRGETFSV